MTDELSMQQQIPQQRGSYVVPGAVTGLVAGGAAGAGLAHYKNWGVTYNKPDLDKVFEQEADSFNGKIDRAKGDNKAFFEAAKEEVQKIKDAGAEFDKIEAEVKNSGKPAISELPDGDIKTNLDNAKKAYETALESEKVKVKSTMKTSSSGFNILTPEEVLKIGDIKPAEFNKYQTLYNNYQRELSNARRTGAVVEKQALRDFQSGIYTDFVRIAGSDKGAAKKMNIVRTRVNAMFPYPPKPTDAELKARGVDITSRKAKNEYIAKQRAIVDAKRQSVIENILGEQIEVDKFDSKGKFKGKRVSFQNVEDLVEAYKKRTKNIADIRRRHLSPMAEAKAIRRVDTHFQRTLDSIYGRISHIDVLKGDIEKAVLNDSAVKTAYNNIKSYVSGPGHEGLKEASYKVTKTVAYTDDEILTKAKEALKDSEVLKTLHDAEKAANEELAKLGKSTGELTGDDLAKAIKEKCGAATKEEYTKAVKEKAAERLKGLAEKAKIANKTWTGVAAAAGLGLIGGLIGMSMKKDA